MATSIGFVMRIDNLSFPEAVERLAREAGLGGAAPARREERAARGAARHAPRGARSRRGLVRGAAARPARAHRASTTCKRRGLRTRPSRASASATRRRRGALQGGAGKAGIERGADARSRPDRAARGRPTAYDRFRGRVMFPIADRRGRVIAFGGRILGEGSRNTSTRRDTPLFHKGRTLYGLGPGGAGRRARRPRSSSARATWTSSPSTRPGSTAPWRRWARR